MNRAMQFQGEKYSSIGPKVVITCLYCICTAVAAWVTFVALDEGDRMGNFVRQAVMLACALIYIVRAAVTLFVFVTRKIPWWEAVWGGAGIGFALFLFVREGLRTPQPFGFVDVAGMVLYITGSYVGTVSEHSRHLWKAIPGNHGHLYMEGLFKHCRHINYFGDLLLFCGFAVLSRQLWTGIVPLIMVLNFVFMIIPAHDNYLAARYGREFEEYARRTKKLVPFLY